MKKEIEIWDIRKNKLVKSILVTFKAIELDEIREMCRQCSVDKHFYIYKLVDI